MLTIHKQSSGNVLGVRASGRITHWDCQQLGPRLEELIRQHRTVRLLFEMEDCQGLDLGAVWDELTMWLNHGGALERCAVIGQKTWQQRLTQLSRPFFKGKYFDAANRDQAWQWVFAGAQSTSPRLPAPRNQPPRAGIWWD